jgi:predicted O-linked N-acetylglucosamine transferase (SPINDLY family)
VPVVTLPSFQLPGRFTMGLYREMGIDACIAQSEEDFVARAVRFGTEPDHRRAVSAQILERAPALFDRPDTGRILGDELFCLAEAAR